MPTARFEIFRGSRNEFRFRLVAPNGEIIAASQGYDAKVSCHEAIESTRRHAPISATVDTTGDEAASRTPAVEHGVGWVAIYRLVQSSRFRGMWWRDTLTGKIRRRLPAGRR